MGSDRSTGQLLNGETNRHFRSRSAGLFVQDGVKLAANLTINAGCAGIGTVLSTKSTGC